MSLSICLHTSWRNIVLQYYYFLLQISTDRLDKHGIIQVAQKNVIFTIRRSSVSLKVECKPTSIETESLVYLYSNVQH